jgi:hypothetical protein
MKHFVVWKFVRNFSDKSPSTFKVEFTVFMRYSLLAAGALAVSCAGSYEPYGSM